MEYRTGDMHVPKIDITEALRTEAEHFIDCIIKKKRPISDGQQGLRVVRLLEAAEKSLKNNSKTVRLDKKR